MSVQRDDPPIVLDDGWECDEPSDDDPGVHRPRRRVVAALVAVAGLMLASVIVTAFDAGDSGPSRPDTSGLAGVRPGSLPDTVTEAWSTRFSGTGSAVATSVVVDDGLVVAVVNDGSGDRSLVAGVEAATGDQLWRRSYPFSPAEMSPLLVHDGTVVLEQNDRFSSHRLIGISSTDGTDRWERRLSDASVTGVLGGTSLVAEIGGVGSTATTFYSPATGDPVGAADGRVTATDLDGTWFLATDSTLDEVDLADGWSEPATAARIADGGDQRIASVDGRLVTVDPAGRLADVSPDGDLTVLQAYGLPRINAIWPAGERNVVGIGEGEVFGVELFPDAASLTWRRDAEVYQFELTDEGLLLVVGDAAPSGGGELLVVDGATGRELAAFGQLAPGGGVVVTSDGFVTSPDGIDHQAFDLDGTPLWQLDGAGKLAVGEDLVVALLNTPGGFRLTAYR